MNGGTECFADGKTIVAIEKRNVGDSAIFCRYDDNMIRA